MIPLQTTLDRIRRNPVLLLTFAIAVLTATDGVSIEQLLIAGAGILARRYTSPAAEVAAGKVIAASEAFQAGLQEGTDQSYAQGFDDGVNAEAAAPGQNGLPVIAE